LQSYSEASTHTALFLVCHAPLCLVVLLCFASAALCLVCHAPLCLAVLLCFASTALCFICHALHRQVLLLQQANT